MNAPQLSSFQDGHADQLFGNDLNHQRTTIEHELLQRRLQYPQNQQYQNQQQQIQQQQYYENQPQQQFEQNVQSIFGIGQSQPNDEVMGSNTINNMNNFYDGGYYGPFTAANTKDVNTSAFLTALCLNAVVFALLLGSYELFRRWFPSVYSPKSSTDGGRRTSASLSGAPSPSRNQNAESTPAVNINTRLPLGWIPGVARTSWSTVRSSGGLDLFQSDSHLCPMGVHHSHASVCHRWIRSKGLVLLEHGQLAARQFKDVDTDSIHLVADAVCALCDE